MLYLAEIKKQTRTLMGATKSDLKLLACQRNDQTWTPVSGDEIIACENVNNVGEGALLIITLGNNRQIQGTPELAGNRIVRLLQTFSRVLEKSKSQEEEIEQWKQSLTYQSQELARREVEMETRLEQIEQQEQEFQNLEEQRQKLTQAWEDFKQEQQKLKQNQNQLKQTLILEGEQTTKIQDLINILASNIVAPNVYQEQLHLIWSVVNDQQHNLDHHWQQLEQKRTECKQKEGEFNHNSGYLQSLKEDLEHLTISHEKAKIESQLKQQILLDKEYLLQHLVQELQTIEDLQKTWIRASGSIEPNEHKLDFNLLEKMPLGELEEIVNNLQTDLDKFVNFVNEQEEELTLQREAVEELEVKQQSANEYERINLEAQLVDEEEKKRMLDKTLVGQRRNLRERQEFLLIHLRILRRRKGQINMDDDHQNVDLEPMRLHLEEYKKTAQKNKEDLEKNITQIKQQIDQLEKKLEQEYANQQIKKQSLVEAEESCQQIQESLINLQSELNLYQQILHPVQEKLNELRQKLQELENAIKQLDNKVSQQHQTVEKMQEMLIGSKSDLEIA